MHGVAMDSQTWKASASAIVISWDENDDSGSCAGPGSPVGVNDVAPGDGDAPSIVITAEGQSPGSESQGRRRGPPDHGAVLAEVAGGHRAAEGEGMRRP